MSYESLIQQALDCGATKAGIVNIKDVKFDRAFREMCAANLCGNYGRCWTCPPDVGDIDEMIAYAQTFDKILVYQTISELEDSYDFEGMMDAAKEHGKVTARIAELPIPGRLCVGAGGCSICEVCAKKTNEPCRYPDKALASLETYGINVSELARAAGMKYINGQDTVTYFGGVMFHTARCIVDGVEVEEVPGRRLSDVIEEVKPGGIETPCAGHGRCGKCRVRASGALSPLSPSEVSQLSAEEIEAGIRLACCTTIEGDCEVMTTLTVAAKSQIQMDGVMPEIELNPLYTNCGAAVDIGTTTLAARVYDAAGRIVAEASRPNPQSRWGADVLSRIEADLRGEGAELAKTITGAISEMVDEMQVSEVDTLVITGNTAMLHLLTETSTEPLSHAPFAAERLFGEWITAKDLGLHAKDLAADAKVYLPRCMAAFVGADITTALLASDICEKQETRMLVDVGTNGEMALWHEGQLFCCSTAAGPAFEGAGISRGMAGKAGAIDKVTVVDGAIEAHVIGDAEPVGICGSGLVDALACMLETEDMDETGFLEDDEVIIAGDVSITQKDVRQVQLAKSAVCAGLVTLMETASLTEEDVAELAVAGGFGSYLDVVNAGRIGLIPEKLVPKVRVLGNAALSGASMLLLNRELLEHSDALAQSSKIVDLAGNPVFQDAYMEGMMF